MTQITRKTLQALGKNWGKPKFNTKPMETKVRHDIQSYSGEDAQYKGICCAFCKEVSFDKDDTKTPEDYIPYICEHCLASLHNGNF